jgi:cytochrome c oxidase assembly protein subunit 16
MAPTAQDDYEPVRVPRPEGVAEWGAVAEASEDAPIKGHRKEDRWV